MANKKPTDPVHPGEILLEDFMKPAGIIINGLARELRVPATRISAIVNEQRALRRIRPCASAAISQRPANFG